MCFTQLFVPSTKKVVISLIKEYYVFRSSFFTVHNNVEREQRMVTDNKQSKVYCSPDTLTKVIGLQVCAELSYPNATSKVNAPFFPLTGPASAGVYLYKRDTHTYYEMSAKSKHVC